MSIEYSMNSDRISWLRKSQGLLEFLADLGGLLDILWLFGSFLTLNAARFSLSSGVLSNLFLQKDKGKINEVKVMQSS